jgi:hypothetical protein
MKVNGQFQALAALSNGKKERPYVSVRPQSPSGFYEEQKSPWVQSSFGLLNRPDCSAFAVPTTLIRLWMFCVRIWTNNQVSRSSSYFVPLFPSALFFLQCFTCSYLVLCCSGIGLGDACCGFFQQEKSDGFGRERTRELGYQRPGC